MTPTAWSAALTTISTFQRLIFEEHQGPDLDALPFSVVGICGIYESRVWHFACRLPIIDGVETLDQKALSRRHAMTIIPFLFGVVSEIEQFKPVALS